MDILFRQKETNGQRLHHRHAIHHQCRHTAQRVDLEIGSRLVLLSFQIHNHARIWHTQLFKEPLTHQASACRGRVQRQLHLFSRANSNPSVPQCAL